MSKKLIALIILLLVLPLTTYGATVPADPVWIVPDAAKPGEEVSLNAFVSNTSAKSATITVVFTVDGKEIGNNTVSLAAGAAKTASISWIVPQKETVVTATITKAIDAKKVSITELLGDIGIVTVGGLSADTLSLPSDSAIKKWFASITAHIEPFRLKEAIYFRDLRDATRARLGIVSSTSTPTPSSTTPEAAALPQQTNNAGTLSDLSALKTVHGGDYVTLIYATALATLFSSILLFYLLLIGLIILVIRFIFRLFS